MSESRRKYEKEFKLKVISEVDSGMTLSEVARRYDISASMINKWKRAILANPKDAFSGSGSRNTDKAKKIAQLERTIGRQTIEIDFLKNLNCRLKGIER